MKLPKLPDIGEEIKSEKPKAKKEKLKIPKSQYDQDGNPILTIPDLNDIDLNGEINKYFGKEED